MDTWCVSDMRQERDSFIVPTTKSDIWSIGASMIALMDLESDMTLANFHHADGMPQTQDATFDFYRENDCGRLMHLVHRCVRADPAERISASQLWDEIQEQVGAFRSLSQVPMKLTPVVDPWVVLDGRDHYPEFFQ